MKRITALILTVILCFSLSACGKTNDLEAIASELNGTSWVTEIIDNNSYTAWTFDYGIVAVLTSIGGITGKADKGTFEVTDDAVLLTWDDPDCGRVKELYYTFENNELKLYSDKEKEKALNCIQKTEGHDKIETNDAKNEIPDTPSISKENAEKIARQEIVNLCCDKSYVTTVNIDYGSFTHSANNRGGYEFEASGTYLPKDEYGLYGDRMKFSIRLNVDGSGKVTVNSKQFSKAYQ